ncbi:hypothetical protein BDQ17DRAFT_1542189 [Cyathus striatus]|nr:hypothetical protein BDQ17DRAFT_1542189 [Cyathus striatus]
MICTLGTAFLVRTSRTKSFSWLISARVVGSLIILVLEVLASFQDEYRLIWRQPRTLVTSLYLFSRYFALLSQSVNCCLVFSLLSNPPISQTICSAWLHFLMITSQAMLTTLESVLMLRVYALYLQNSKIGAWLLFVFVVDLVMALLFGVRTLPALHYDEVCAGHGTPPEVLYFGGCVIATQLMLWAMTIFKCNIAIGGVPVVRLVLRDGAFAFALVCIIFGICIPYSFVQDLTAHVVFLWPISLMSMTTCRIILNMHRLKVIAPSISTEFTSYFEFPASDTVTTTLS